MKNITKYILAAAAAFSSLTACQEFEDFDKTIDGTPGLVYVQTGTENLYTIRVVHKPTGSTGEFFTEFPVRCNTTRHAGVKATFVYDASLVESYNAEHKTSYAALPAEYLTLENTTLTVPENATASADSVKVTLTGNLSLLTERNYLAPLRIKAEGIDASEVMGAVYVAVATEINLIRAIESTDDMVGFTATGRSAWTARLRQLRQSVRRQHFDVGRFSGTVRQRAQYRHERAATGDRTLSGIRLRALGVDRIQRRRRELLAGRNSRSGRIRDGRLPDVRRILRTYRSPLPAADHRLFEQLEQNPFRNRHLQDRQRRSDRLCRDRHGKPHHG